MVCFDIFTDHCDNFDFVSPCSRLKLKATFCSNNCNDDQSIYTVWGWVKVGVGWAYIFELNRVSEFTQSSIRNYI